MDEENKEKKESDNVELININEEQKNNSEKDKLNIQNEEENNILNIEEEQKKISENKNNYNNEYNRKDSYEEDKENKISLNRSPLSLEGAKYPLSIYTRRVMNTSRINEYLNEDSSAGICGGYNLGNTCFMNSSIACISNCVELTYYFLCGDYKKDINIYNKNGMEGELAKSWGDLLHEYWVENTKVGNPRDFKNTIGAKAVRFKGYGQQDSNEFMNIFLDYLNEDLNATTQKEYIELEEKKEYESDLECAKRFWDLNLKRNDSIITDLFCGQFKSTITCTNCNWISITFEPFYSIILPLKENKRKQKSNFIKEDIDQYMIFYISKFGLRIPYKIIFYNIPNTTKYGDCFNILKNDTNFKYKELLKKVNYMKIDSKQYEKEMAEDDIIDEYNQNIVLYELNDEENNYFKIPIYVLYLSDIGENKLSTYPRFVFGNKDMNIEDLEKNIYFLARKYILSPFLKYGEEIDELSKIIMKFQTDESIEDIYLLDLIDKEYKRIFNENLSEEDIEFLQDFIEDKPFKIKLREKDGAKIIQIFDDKYLNKFTNEFIQFAEITTLQTYIKDIIDKISDYVITIEFNIESKYINQQNFKLNNFFVKKMEFPKMEEKDEEKDAEKEEYHKPNLIECLNFFCKEEQLKKGNEWFCKNCKKNVLPMKKIDFFYLPKILIIAFKRFIKESSRWEKNEEDIDFPINNFDMKDIIIGPDKNNSIYDLFAVSQHYGSTGFGHYTAVCKNGDKWYNYDDSSVSQTSAKSALNSAAYVLFYRRQTD